MMSTKLKVVSPVGEPGVKEISPPPSLNTLNGKTVCEVWNGGFEGHVSFPIVREMLQKRYPDVKVIPYTELPMATIPSFGSANKAQTLEALRVALAEKGCDAVITGNGG
ncbi:MAG: hypothetical protein ABSH06_05570 [Thermodesulfobacteriota bacterium]